MFWDISIARPFLGPMADLTIKVQGTKNPMGSFSLDNQNKLFSDV